MENLDRLLRIVRAVAALLLVALYAAGLIAMLASKVQLALILWVISTLGGIGLLYWLKTAKRNSEDSAGSETPQEDR